jgi:RNA polymerase sigma-70 factor, ECF subfamily
LHQDPRQRTDEELLRSSREDDVAAFGELVRRYESKVAATVVGMLGPGNEADDVGQETFIRFYHALKSFREEASIGTYITRIAINLSLNELRRRKRRRFLFKPTDPESDAEEPAADDTSDRFDKKEIIERALKTLSPKFRSVVTLRLIEGYSTEETAKILRVPVGTVLSRLLRAQKKLQTALHSYKEGF